jgi:TPR repeat protein
MRITLEKQTENFQISDLRRQAEQGDAEAQYNLGMLYYEGHGVTQDYATARHWWEQAAAQGNAWAQYRLGVLYQKGRGAPQDDATAREWFEKSAVQGGVKIGVGCQS